MTKRLICEPAFPCRASVQSKSAVSVPSWTHCPCRGGRENTPLAAPTSLPSTCLLYTGLYQMSGPVVDLGSDAASATRASEWASALREMDATSTFARASASPPHAAVSNIDRTFAPSAGNKPPSGNVALGLRQWSVDDTLHAHLEVRDFFSRYITVGPAHRCSLLSCPR